LYTLNAMLDKAKQELDKYGYTILPGVIDGSRQAALGQRLKEIFATEGARAGWEFRTEPGARRLANLVNKGAVFVDVVTQPEVTALARYLLGADVKLSSLNARMAMPGEAAAQPLHVDMGLLPDERGPLGLNSVWMLDEFRGDNGTIRIVPGSHRSGARPQDALEDPAAPHPQEVLVTGAAGDILVFNAHAWHAGTANRSNAPRLALNCFYCRRDQPQQTWHKKWIDPHLQNGFSPPLRELLALDDPENDRLSADPAERSGFMKAAP